MKRIRTTAALVFTAFMIATASDARAQTAPEREHARALMDEGDAKRDAKDYSAALKAYQGADNIMHVPSTGIEVARMQVQLGMLLEARETLSAVKSLPAKPNEPAAFVKARKDAEQLSDELARRIPAIQLVISGTPAGQVPEVTIDNEAVPAGALNVPRKVNPGSHKIRVKSRNDEKTEDVTVAEKETKTVDIDLKPKTEPPRQAQTMDEKGGGSSTGKALMFGGFGVAVVGIGVGAVTGLMSMSKVSDIKNDCQNDKCLPTRADDIDSAKTLGNISTIAFAVGGVGAVVGVVGLLMSNGGKAEATVGKAKPSTPRAHAVVGPSFMGLAGTF